MEAKKVIIYRTSGSPSAWSDWYFSDFDTVEETESELIRQIESKYGTPEEFRETCQNQYYPTFQVDVLEGETLEELDLTVSDMNGCPYAAIELDELYL